MAERLEEITERHLNRPRLDGTPWCTYCSQRFPCDVKVALAEAERLRSESSAAVGAAAKYLAEVERLRGVVEAGKALLIQSQLKEDRSNWEEWYEVCVPEWEALRAALAELEAKP